MTSKTIFISFFVSLCLLAACGAMEDTWEGTSGIASSAYNSTREFVNPDPEVNLDAYQVENPNQEKLATLFSPVDEQVAALMRYVEDQDLYPSDEWLDLLFMRYPWIHGVIVANAEGDIKLRKPEIPVKRFSQPLWFEGVWRETLIKTVVDYPDLGPEMYVGTPFFKDISFMGLIVVHFDPRTLLDFCPNPEELLIIQPDGDVWTKRVDVDKEALMNIPWSEKLEDQVQGTVSAGGRNYTWLARFIGRDLFVYATESVDSEYDDSWIF